MEHAKKLFTAKEAFESLMLGDIGLVHNKVDNLKVKLDGLGTSIGIKMEALPGLADKEMKRAGDAAIEALADRVAGIANTIAGDAAKTERNKSALKLTYTNLAALLLSAVIFGGAGYVYQEGVNAVNLSRAKDLVAEANAATEKATADLAAYQAVADKNAAAEIAKIRAASGWAGTPTGRLAKQFFDLGYGGLAATCKAEKWDIEDRKEGKWCVPQRRDLIGGDSQKYGWKIP